MTDRRPTCGVGSNQYQSRGRPVAKPDAERTGRFADTATGSDDAAAVGEPVWADIPGEDGSSGQHGTCPACGTMIEASTPRAYTRKVQAHLEAHVQTGEAFYDERGSGPYWTAPNEPVDPVRAAIGDGLRQTRQRLIPGLNRRDDAEGMMLDELTAVLDEHGPDRLRELVDHCLARPYPTRGKNAAVGAGMNAAVARADELLNAQTAGIR